MTAQHLEPTHGSATSTGALGSKRRAIAIAVLCILLLAAAGTIAFTTRTQTAENVLTFGSVKMQVLETEQAASGEVAVPDGHEVEAASGKASRIVRFQNVGASTMYVRARPVMAVERADEAEVSQDQVSAVVEFGMDQSGAWQEGSDGWWYYVAPVEAGAEGDGQTTSPLMESIEFKGDFYSVAGPGGKFVFTVEAQAVQADNNGSSALEAQGWPVEGAQQ